jgi:hypothetical protein
LLQIAAACLNCPITRIRELLSRLDEIQAESRFIRERIAGIKRDSPEFPDRRRASRLFHVDSEATNSRPPNRSGG